MQKKNNFNKFLLIVAVSLTALLFKLRLKRDRPSKNFSWDEFASKDGAEMPADVKENIKKVAQNLEVIRSYFNLPIKVNSGYRSPEHNTKVGGAKFSQHVKGNAADIVIKGKTPREVQAGIEYLIKAGKISQGGIGNYPNFTHYDIRGTKARW